MMIGSERELAPVAKSIKKCLEYNIAQLIYRRDGHGVDAERTLELD